MKKTEPILLLIPFLLACCNQQKVTQVPIYHVDGINYHDDRYHHLLYRLDQDVLLSLREKKASFFFAIYSASCNDSCSIFDYSLYGKANEDNFLIPYIDKGDYDSLVFSDFPSVRGNALLFFSKGSLFQRIDIGESNVSLDRVSKIIDTYTYDTKTYLVSPIQKNSSGLDSFCFAKEEEDGSGNSISYLETMEKPVLFVDFSRTEELTDIQSRKGLSSLYFYEDLSCLNERFYEKTGLKKEELVENPSYLLS